MADGANAMLASSPERGADPATRERLVALTLTAGEPGVAWDALAAWAESHGDVVLWARALREVVRVLPGRRQEIATAAEALAGMGALAEARSVAAAAIEAGEAPLGGTDHELARRLAVDLAIEQGAPDRVQRMASRARLPLDEAAGRALLAGKWELARSLAEVEAGGDPAARGARWVLAICTRADLGSAAEPRPGDVDPSGAAFVVYARALADENRSRALAPPKPGVLVAGDDRVVRAAVELASRGVLDPKTLPGDGQVELAALQSKPPVTEGVALDERHTYLALSLTRSNPDRERALGARLSGVAPADPIVQAAGGLSLLASGAPVPADAPRKLLATNPADPLLAAVALRLAEKVGDTQAAAQARATLSAVTGGAF
jgi:hypothetical protein